MNDILDAMFLWPTWPVVVGLFALMFACNESAFRIADHYFRNEPEKSRTVSTSLSNSILGLLALLLGFSFAMSSGRHDQRRRFVLDEANAIGTCHLRAGLLPEPHRSDVKKTLQKYLEMRLEMFEKALDPAQLTRCRGEMDRLLDQLWKSVEAVAQADRAIIVPSQIVPAANQVIDLSAAQIWALQNHVPGPVVLLLFTSVLVSCGLIGYSSGQTGLRQWGHWIAFNTMFTLTMFVILDFDRSRRGLIQVNHAPLIELKQSLSMDKK
ncbi:MAG: hypothetical protein K1X57_07275 [Gemmataceae bacterium]|nr:hypothetical protein [Gemmataceae bacterium]